MSTMHSISTLTVSRDLQNPASSIVKPTCIPNTRNAAINVHTVFNGFTTSFALIVGSAAKTRKPNKSGLNRYVHPAKIAMPKQLARQQHHAVAAPLRALESFLNTRQWAPIRD